MFSKQNLNYNKYPYQVIDGEVCNLNSPPRKLWYTEYLENKPLLPLLLYLTSQGVSIKKSTEWCSVAARIGDLEALQWLRDAGAPWDEWVCVYAASNGHLKILRWARASGAPWDICTCAYAADADRMEVLCWAYANGCPCIEWNAKKAQQMLLLHRQINWSWQCKERWSEKNRKLFLAMINKVVNDCNKVTYDLLPTCLSNLIITYL